MAADRKYNFDTIITFNAGRPQEFYDISGVTWAEWSDRKTFISLILPPETTSWPLLMKISTCCHISPESPAPQWWIESNGKFYFDLSEAHAMLGLVDHPQGYDLEILNSIIATRAHSNGQPSGATVSAQNFDHTTPTI